MAHPDDIEITCAGTLILLHQAGWRVHMATMTAGDMGSVRRSRASIARIRRREAAASARVLGAEYTCLGFDDLTIVYDGPSKRRVSGFLREVRPDLVITPAPVDYMADHEETARLVREAAFASTMPNWRTTWTGSRPRSGTVAPCDRVPALLYADPIDLTDHVGRRVGARYVVDIMPVIDVKERMLAAHESQRAWLREQHGEDEYLRWMRRVAADRARDARRRRVKYAEGFVPHLGHGFPHDDVLTPALGNYRVRTLSG
jgi:LmbE family N-acetylglucosaminyl deacetylase